MGISLNILKHSAIYSGANSLGKLVGFILLPFYAHIFDTEGYGVIGMLDGSIGLLSILFGAASSNAILRVYHSKDRDPDSCRAVISTSIWLMWLFSLLLIALPLVFSRPLSQLLLASAEYHNAVILALLTFAISMGNKSAENHLIIKQQSIIYSFVGLFRLVFGISLNIYLVIILKIGVIGIFISSFLNALISGIIVHWLALRSNGFSYDKRVGKEVLAMWLPLMPGEFFGYVGRQAERFFVRFLINIQGVGILEMAYKFPPLLGLFIAQPFLLAWRTKSFEIAEENDAPVIMGKMYTNMLFLLTAAGLLLAVTIDELLVLLTPESFWGASRIARIETLTTIVAASNTYFLFGLLHANQPLRITTIQTSMAALKIAISWIFISSLGLQGAALSAIIVQTLTFIWIFSASQSLYRIHVEYGKVASILVCAVIMAFVIEYAQRTNQLIGFDFFSTCVKSTFQFIENSTSTTSGTEHILSTLKEKSNVLAIFFTEAFWASLFGLGIFFVRPSLGRSLLQRFKAMTTKRSEISGK